MWYVRPYMKGKEFLWIGLRENTKSKPEHLTRKLIIALKSVYALSDFINLLLLKKLAIGSMYVQIYLKVVLFLLSYDGIQMGKFKVYYQAIVNAKCNLIRN